MPDIQAPAFRYRYHGLCVECSFLIEEWEHFQQMQSDTAPDVLISIDRTPHIERLPPEPGEYRFFVRDAGWLTVKRGTEIVIAPGSIEIGRRLRLFLTGSAWGALLYQRGLLLLHASAVSTESGAVLFCGRRGQGKSTLAAFLIERGYRLISDDLCCVDMGETGMPLVHPSVPRFKLWSDSIHELGWDRNEPERDHVRAGKFHYFRPSQTVFQPLPIAAVYLLSWGDAGFERLGGFSALNRLFNAAVWRGDLLVAAGNPPEYFRRCTEIVRRVPVWEFRRPREFPAIPLATELLLGHLSQNRTDSRQTGVESC